MKAFVPTCFSVNMAENLIETICCGLYCMAYYMTCHVHVYLRLLKNNSKDERNKN